MELPYTKTTIRTVYQNGAETLETRIEQGVAPTEWNENTFDDRVSTKASSISTSANHISSRVSDKNYQSEITQTPGLLTSKIIAK